MDPIQIPWVLLAAIGLVAAIQTIGLGLRASLPGRRAVRRARRAALAETAAEPLRRRLGYRTIHRQARAA